jgi:hypothetical protein
VRIPRRRRNGDDRVPHVSNVFLDYVQRESRAAFGSTNIPALRCLPKNSGLAGTPIEFSAGTPGTAVQTDRRLVLVAAAVHEMESDESATLAFMYI